MKEELIKFSPEQAAQAAQQIVSQFGRDPEALHGYLDDLLCQVLMDEGYTELVRVFNVAPKWYA